MTKLVAKCFRCESEVETEQLYYYKEQGYWAYCPYHDEDLFRFECYVEVTL